MTITKMQRLIIKFVDFRTRYSSKEGEKALPSSEALDADYRMNQLSKLINFFQSRSRSEYRKDDCQDNLIEVDLTNFASTEDMQQQSPVLIPLSFGETITPSSVEVFEKWCTVVNNLKGLISLEDSDDEIIVELYIATFSYDFRLLYQAIDDFIGQLTKLLHSLQQEYIQMLGKSSKIRLQITVLEDLIYIERPYIMESKHKNFFKNIVTKYSDKTLSHHVTTTADTNNNCESRIYSQTISVQSSNAIMNQWGEGDCRVVTIPEFQNPDERRELYWHRILNEIHFSEMFNQGNKVPRLIAIQSVEDPVLGKPLYRHPNDEEPPNVEMIPLVREIMGLVEQYTGVQGLNHVLIQHYRDGRDNIAQHSDKTLDIDLETPILNLSFGCSRDMYIQNKENRSRIEKIPLCHGECVLFGLRSNQYWYHEVPKDVIMATDPLFGTSRVSFTFRKIATFLHRETGLLLGQGSPFKSLADYTIYQHEATEGKHHETDVRSARSELIFAFGKENRQSGDFNWQEVYGRGFLIK